jgi:hypothetical protein
MLNLAQFTGQFVDDAPATQPDAAQSIAAFTQQYGSSLERIDTSNKYLMLLSILDYLGSNDPANYPMDFAVSYQDGDGYLSAGIDEDSPDYSLSEWLQHFAWIAQESGSDRVLWSIAANLFTQLRGQQ